MSERAWACDLRRFFVNHGNVKITISLISSGISGDERNIAHTIRERSTIVKTGGLGNVRGGNHTYIVRVGNNRPVDYGC